MKYLASPELCVKPDNSLNVSKSIANSGKPKDSNNNGIVSLLGSLARSLGSRVHKRLVVSTWCYTGRKEKDDAQTPEIIYPKLGKEGTLLNNVYSATVKSDASRSLCASTLPRNSYDASPQLKDNSSSRGTFCSELQEVHGNSSYESNTLSNTSLMCRKGTKGRNESYLDSYAYVQENEAPNDEIILEIRDNSETLRKTMNLDTLSRIDSMCMGKKSAKLGYMFTKTKNTDSCCYEEVRMKSTPLCHKQKKPAKKIYTERNVAASGDSAGGLKPKRIKKGFIRLYGVIIMYYTILVTAVYLLICENPLWEGIATRAWELLYANERLSYGFLIWILVVFINFVPPMLVFFEEDEYDTQERDTSDVALIIPAYMAAKILPKTLGAATQVFPPENIFVIANGNSVYPIDNTEEVCAHFNVNHCWVPYGCKLGALYVGVCRVANFKYVVTIDDDCLLPINFPIPKERFKNGVACIGYTITSCGPNFTKGNIVHKLQDIEYKLAGLMKHFQGKFGGSTMFPHGAVSMWDRGVIYKLFEKHPGYRFGEDWFFGHVARESGYRIELCSRVFVKTETPRSMFIAPNTTRGGFGELTVAKQRIFRWNYFLLKCLMDNFHFILFCWRMPKWYHNVLSKIWVSMEVVQTLQYVLFPLGLPLFFTNTYFTISVTVALMGFSLFMVVMFNFLHLGRKSGARVDWIPVLIFVPYVILCYATNFLSYIWAILHYGIYYSRKHLRITKIPEVVSIVSGGIDNIARNLHKTMSITEQTNNNESPKKSENYFEALSNSDLSHVGSVTKDKRHNEYEKECYEVDPHLYPSPYSQNFKVGLSTKSYPRKLMKLRYSSTSVLNFVNSPKCQTSVIGV